MTGITGCASEVQQHIEIVTDRGNQIDGSNNPNFRLAECKNIWIDRLETIRQGMYRTDIIGDVWSDV
jgi:hypothetical protein